jgi:hypothetical protein
MPTRGGSLVRPPNADGKGVLRRPVHLRDLLFCLFATALCQNAGCTGGAHPSTNTIATPGDNVTEIVVDQGLPNIGYLNGLFVTVTVCVPGSASECQAIDHVLVDTGSTGLRVLGSVLTLALPAWIDDSGSELAECGQFVSGSVWGPLRGADLNIANEKASSLAIHVIDKVAYPMPVGCTGTDISTPDMLGANGILGVSSFLRDCGSACAAGIGKNSENPGVYYVCSSSPSRGCQPTAVPVHKQVSNPVTFFAQNNNGTIIQLPAIPSEGATSVTGSMVFGIGTRDNNGLGDARIVRLDDSGEFLIKFPTNGKAQIGFIDSGSNAIFFQSSAITGIPACSNSLAPSLSEFYCPASTLKLPARVMDTYGKVDLNVDFTVGNTVLLLARGDNNAFDSLAGQSGIPYFDWGLPFHFGKNVFTAIEGQATPGGEGPFVAF